MHRETVHHQLIGLDCVCCSCSGIQRLARGKVLRILFLEPSKSGNMVICDCKCDRFLCDGVSTIMELLQRVYAILGDEDVDEMIPYI